MGIEGRLLKTANDSTAKWAIQSLGVLLQYILVMGSVGLRHTNSANKGMLISDIISSINQIGFDLIHANGRNGE